MKPYGVPNGKDQPWKGDLENAIGCISAPTNFQLKEYNSSLASRLQTQPIANVGRVGGGGHFTFKSLVTWQTWQRGVAKALPYASPAPSHFLPLHRADAPLAALYPSRPDSTRFVLRWKRISSVVRELLGSPRPNSAEEEFQDFLEASRSHVEDLPNRAFRCFVL